MRVACTGLTLALSSAANGMSRSVRLKCWLQPWTFLCQSCSRGGDERLGCVQGAACGKIKQLPANSRLLSAPAARGGESRQRVERQRKHEREDCG